MNPPTNFSRQTAIKMSIKDILNCKYVSSEEDDTPNYLLTKNEIKIFRVNILAIILKKEIQGTITNFLIDDGTENILLRFFENDPKIETLEIGNSVLVIGKLRKYNHEKYISPEIYKKTSAEWLKVRYLELNMQKEKEIAKPQIEVITNKTNPELETKITLKNKVDEVEKENISKKTVTNKKKEISSTEEDTKTNDKEKEEQELLPIQKILNLIKVLDQGEGVIIEEVIKQSPLENENTEKLINKMMQNGDIFQNSPGKVKVL